jgi:hypothetical protein
MVMHVRPDKED